MTLDDVRQLAEQAASEGWEVFPHHQDGALSGVAVLRGTEFHCQLVDGFRLRRAEMREFLRPLFEREGFLTTRVRHDDVANQRFNKAFGFEKTWSDDVFHYYILTALPFERRARCQ